MIKSSRIYYKKIALKGKKVVQCPMFLRKINWNNFMEMNIQKEMTRSVVFKKRKKKEVKEEIKVLL
jgi:hypothetical protein